MMFYAMKTLTSYVLMLMLMLSDSIPNIPCYVKSPHDFNSMASRHSMAKFQHRLLYISWSRHTCRRPARQLPLWSCRFAAL